MTIVNVLLRSITYWINVALVSIAVTTLSAVCDFDYRSIHIMPWITCIAVVGLFDALPVYGRSILILPASMMMITCIIAIIIALALKRVPGEADVQINIGNLNGIAGREIVFSAEQTCQSSYFTLGVIVFNEIVRSSYHFNTCRRIPQHEEEQHLHLGKLTRVRFEAIGVDCSDDSWKPFDWIAVATPPTITSQQIAASSENTIALNDVTAQNARIFL
jgi:hypothetical protein